MAESAVFRAATAVLVKYSTGGNSWIGVYSVLNKSYYTVSSYVASQLKVTQHAILQVAGYRWDGLACDLCEDCIMEVWKKREPTYIRPTHNIAGLRKGEVPDMTKAKKENQRCLDID